MGRRSPIATAFALVACLWLAPSCASVQFDRDTPTSGTFESSAWSFTIISFDFPGPAVQIAQRNVSSSGQPNLVIEKSLVIPHLGPLDFLLDILCIRYAKISGTWGYAPGE